MIRAGESTVHEFVVDEHAMQWFQTLSNDMSRIHCDAAFARERGFKDVIVYGGILLAHLSHVLGMHLPGTNGTSTKWTINYREPLYVGEKARLTLEITYASRATGMVEGKFSIASGERTIATGMTQSIVPADEISQEQV
jgi:3-hydroxybutyryl-CoA dehydratase